MCKVTGRRWSEIMHVLVELERARVCAIGVWVRTGDVGVSLRKKAIVTIPTYRSSVWKVSDK